MAPLALLLALPLAASAHVRLELVGEESAVSRGSTVAIDARAVIEEGWHINAHRPAQSYLIPTALRVTLLPPGIVAGEVRYPQPVERRLAFAGGETLLVYEGAVLLETDVTVPADYPGRRIRIEAVLRYQACNDATCLKPKTVKTELLVPIAMAAAAANSPSAADASSPAHDPSEGRIARLVRERGIAVTLLALVLLGLGLNLTPCVYPLISVTVAYFGGQTRDRAGVIRLALLYVLGIALSFSALGVAAALSGGLFGAALQQPLVVAAIAGTLVILALGNFGLYQLRLPAALASRVGASFRGSMGAFFMGLTMGVVAAPCVGPIVVGLLVFVGSRQDPLLGFATFFALALGMGAPYVALAVAAGSLDRLPRSGEWLLWTERLFGCLLLALAAYFAAPLIPDPFSPVLLPSVLAASALYLGIIERAGNTVRRFRLVKWGTAIVLLVAALWIGWPQPTGPTVTWDALSTVELRTGRVLGDHRPLLLDFAADWCIPCREMDETTYRDPEVLRESMRFRMVRGDLTSDDEATDALARQYSVPGVPTVILYSRDGREQARLVGYVGPKEMLAAMSRVH